MAVFVWFSEYDWQEILGSKQRKFKTIENEKQLWK